MKLRWMIVVALLSTLRCLAAEPSEKRLWILVPVFRVEPSPGNPTLGTKVSTYLFLQLFTGLRKAPTPNPLKLDFGKGGVTWDSESLPPTTFAEANQLARAQAEDPIMVFWGDVTQYADHVFVSPRLSIRTDDDVRDITWYPWSVTVNLKEEPVTLKARLPRTHYDFQTFQLKDDVLANLNEPGGLPLFAEPSADSQHIGKVGDYFTRVSQQGDFAQVTIPNSAKQGWIRTPSLSSKRVESLAFAAGILKIFRQDWEGAEHDFSDALGASVVPLPVRVDSQLYFALIFSKEKRHDNAIAAAQKALHEDKFSFPAVQFLALSYLETMNENPELFKRAYLEDLEILAYRDIWPRVHSSEDEQWASQLKDLVSRLRTKQERGESR